jgi:hypothetical protein
VLDSLAAPAGSPEGTKEPFKMSKFTKHAKPVVTKYMRQPQAATAKGAAAPEAAEIMAPPAAAAVEAC